MRRVTISCPGCRTEFPKVFMDEAERILFHGCETCRVTNPTFRFRGTRNTSRPLS